MLHPLCRVPFSVHVSVAWWEQSQHTRADCVLARLQATARSHQVSSRGRATQVDKSSTFQVNRDYSWKSYRKSELTTRLKKKYLALLGFLGNQGLKGIWGNAHLSAQVPTESQLSILFTFNNPSRSLTSLHFLACDLTLYTFAYQGFL